MRRNGPLLTLLAVEAGVAALGAFFYLKARPSVLEAFRAYATPLPPLTAVALSAWLLPAALAVAAACSLVAVVAPFKRSRRLAVVRAGLLVLSCAVIFAVWAGFAPVFRPD